MKVFNKVFNNFEVAFVLITVISIVSCNNNPEPINYGQDECDYCRMLISDNKYGAELITDKGKIYKFDSIECMIQFSLVKNTLGDANNNLLITNFDNPGNLIDARIAYYIKNDEFRSPMGLNVTAFKDESKAQQFISANGGEKLIWVEVIELVKQRSL